jgi:CDP-diacylglycerol--glycerol-3-phosphate 3-phosphatidyltransferase
MAIREIVNVPNLLTISRIFLTPLFLAMLFADTWYWRSMACVVFALASVTDFYDGRMARSNNRVTDFGRFMDPLADKILVTSALIALVLGRIVHYWLVLPIVVRDIIITGMRLYGVYHGRQMETSRLAKWKTFAQLLAVVIILFAIGLQEVFGRFEWDHLLPLEESLVPTLSNGLMAAVLLLTLASGFHYFIRTGYSVRS